MQHLEVKKSKGVRKGDMVIESTLTWLRRSVQDMKRLAGSGYVKGDGAAIRGVSDVREGENGME